MARKITAGLVGSPTFIGSIQISSRAELATAGGQDIILAPGVLGKVVSQSDVQINAQGDLRFADADSSNYVGFQAPTTITANTVWTLPSVDGGAGQFLATDAAGTLSWAAGSLSLTDQTISAVTHYPLFTTASSGTITASSVSSTKFSFRPSTGTLTVTAITESSSIALKENVSPITGALDAILNLVGVTYDRRDGSSKTEAGLIAEEVNKIIPNIVSKDANGDPEGIHYSKLTAYLVEAVKTLKQEINELKGN